MYMDNIFFELLGSFGSLFSYVLKAFYPLLFGLFFAYLLSNPVDWIHSKLFKNCNNYYLSQCPKGMGIAILITYLLFFIAVFAVIFSFIYLIIGTIPPKDIIGTVEKLAGTSWFERFFSTNNLMNILSNTSGLVINIALGIVCSIYLLKDKALFLMLWQKALSIFLKQKTHGIVNETLHDINLVLSTFIKGAAIDSVLVALLSSIVLTILNVKFAVIIGIMGGILNIIPYFGPFLGMVPAFLVSVTSQGFAKAILTVIALFLIQQLDSNYIYPKVVGTSTGLHPLYILVSLSVMGYFGGILGMLLAVPIASIIQVILKKWFSHL